MFNSVILIIIIFNKFKDIKFIKYMYICVEINTVI